MAVTTALKSIGFAIERERAAIKSTDGDRGRTVRTLVVPSAEAWEGIVNRYFFDPEGGPAPPADPFEVWDHGGVYGGDMSQMSHDPAPLPATNRFAAVQASPRRAWPVGRRGRTTSRVRTGARWSPWATRRTSSSAGASGSGSPGTGPSWRKRRRDDRAGSRNP